MSYLVTGLPRSRTAWTSVFLDCAMHPFNRMVPEEAMKLDFCDPTFLLFWDEFYDGRKVVIIEREFISAMDASVKAFGKGIIPIVDKMERIMRRVIRDTDCHVVDYDKFDGKALWEFVHGEGFDVERFKMLSEINMQTMPNAETKPEAISQVRRVA